MLKKDNVLVALLQETHLADLEQSRLCDWVGQIYYSCFRSKGKGVAILIRKHLAFMLDKAIRDRDGRFVVLTVVQYVEKVLLGSVYAPYIFDNSLYSKLLGDISSVCLPNVVFGGEFNCGLSSDMDYGSPKKINLQKWQKVSSELCSDLDFLMHEEPLITERRILHLPQELPPYRDRGV